jgi:hypothetical protein
VSFCFNSTLALLFIDRFNTNNSTKTLNERLHNIWETGLGIMLMVLNATFIVFSVHLRFADSYYTFYIFNNISVISWRFYWWGKPKYTEKTFDLLQVTDKRIESTSPRAGFELTTLVEIGTDYIGSYKSNYHTITSTDFPCGKERHGSRFKYHIGFLYFYLTFMSLISNFNRITHVFSSHFLLCIIAH